LHLPQLLLDVLSSGALYALLGAGFLTSWRVTGAPNLAHGAFAVTGADLALWLSQSLGLNALLAPMVALAAFVLGWLLQNWLLERLAQRPRRAGLLATLAVGIVCLELVQIFQPSMPPAAGPESEAARLSQLLLAALLLTLWWLWGCSRIGRVMSHVADDRGAAAAAGIDVGRADALAFALGSGLAGAAGALFVLDRAVPSGAGWFFLPVAAATALLARTGGLAGLIGAGLALASVQAALAGMAAPQLENSAAFGLLLLAVIIFVAGRGSGNELP